MSGPGPGLASLPPEFQHVVELAEQRHGVRVTPLDQLAGGFSGAAVHLVSVAAQGSGRLEHCILKLDRRRPSARSGEVDRHTAAMRAGTPAFARSHIPDMAFDPVEDEGAVAIFYRIAGQSLQSFRPLSSYRRQSQLSAILAGATRFLLDDWNASPSFRQATPPQDLLRAWLGFRLKPDGHLDRFLRDSCHLDPGVPGFLVSGKVFRNPIAYARDADRWSTARPVDAIVGFLHGDLNTNNLLVRLGETEAVDGYYLIDFAAFQEGVPLLYDNRYLEMSYLLLAMARVPFASCAALIARLGDADMPDPHLAPVETAGPCAVIAAARRAFAAWVDDNHPSLQDDLWAQYWLAGVAAGLAYCHKPGLGEEQRLAGLLYACANLERYAAAFALPAPEEVRRLYDETGTGGAAVATGSSDRHRRFELPAPPTPFLGRAAELSQGKALLTTEGVRLVTLTGPGGIGKTRLALELAAQSRSAFPDGLVMVDLAPTREPDQVLAAIARAVELRSSGDRPLLEALTGHLAQDRMLLLLDNFEQAMAATPVVAELLRRCSRIVVLATSREALHLRGEHLLPVPVLGLPDPAEAGTTEELSGSEAVRLFVDRAVAVQPDFRLTDENAQAVAEVCVRLDGLPLAIELAAARIALLPPQALLERLGRPLRVLRGGARDLPERQQTLRDTIEWSYELLEPEEQRLFALLSVFSGGTLASVEAVAEASGLLDDGRLDILDGVTSLLDKSLLQPADRATPSPRIRMLQTIRDYAAERLEDDPDRAAAAHRAHAAHFADVAQSRSERLSGAGRRDALHELEADADNLRTAWQHWVAAADLEQLQKMTTGLWAMFDARGWYHSAAGLAADLLHVLETTPSSPGRAQQEILLQMSLARVLLATKGYTQEVEAAYTRALELCRAYGNVPEQFPVLRALATYYVVTSDFEKGRGIGEQLLRLGAEHDDAGMRVDGHLLVATCIFGFDPRGGLDQLEQAIAEYDPDLFRSKPFRMGNDPGVPCYTTAALILWMLGYPDRALARAREALALAERLEHPFSAAYANFHVGLLHLWRREPEQLAERAGDGLRIAESHNFEVWRALSLCLGGAAMAESGRAEEGLEQFERGIRLYQRLTTPPVFWPMLLMVRAGVCARAGRPGEGLALLDEALGIGEPTADDAMSAEVCRLKGELLLAQSADGAEAAEPWFRRAITIAQTRGVAMLELRAAIALSRMLRAQGRTAEARAVLQNAYGKLTEGFTTADAREAQALLAEAA